MKLQQHEKDISREPENDNLRENMCRIKKKLEILSLQKARGSQIRSRTQWVEEGEKNTRFFLNLEKIHAKQNIITQLKINNETISDQFEILDEQAKYYKKSLQ